MKYKGYKSLSVFVRVLLSFDHYDSSIPELSEKQRRINLKLNNTCKARGADTSLFMHVTLHSTAALLDLLLCLVGHWIQGNGSLQDVKLHLVVVHVQDTHDAVVARCHGCSVLEHVLEVYRSSPLIRSFLP